MKGLVAARDGAFGFASWSSGSLGLLRVTRCAACLSCPRSICWLNSNPGGDRQVPGVRVLFYSG
jgi:hypothetical protein